MNQTVLIILICYLVAANVTGLVLMGADKRKARLQKWRIAEKTFFIVSLLGGSLGTWLGMYLFHHKTKHWYFVLFMPLIFAAQVALAVFLIIRF